MEPMKNLCGLIPESLHKRLMENKDPEMTNGEYLTKVLTAYLDQPATPRQEQRTLAVQISEEMFQQLKSYLDAHSPLTQKAFVQSLLNQALGQMCIRDRYGIGVSVVEDTPIDVFFTFDPDPVLDCKILPEEIPEYTVGVIGSWSGERKYLSREEVGQLLSASDPKTRILAEMLRYFEGKTWIVSCADCQEAFGILADVYKRQMWIWRKNSPGVP